MQTDRKEEVKSIEPYQNKKPFEEIEGICWKCTAAVNKGKKRYLNDETKEDNPEWVKSVKRKFIPTKAAACDHDKTEVHIGQCPTCNSTASTIVSLKKKEVKDKDTEKCECWGEIHHNEFDDHKQDGTIIEKHNEEVSSKKKETQKTGDENNSAAE